MDIDVYSMEGKKSGTAVAPAGVFDVPWNPDLVHQALVAQLGNRRQPFAHTKDRSEVSGGGKKPWKQKHTGRARHGSTRSPLWRHGGITFGPRSDRDYTKKLNVKMRRAALLSALSKKFLDGEVRVIERLAVPDTKTKEMAGIIKRFFPGSGSVLCVVARGNSTAFRAGRNLPRTFVIDGAGLNIHELLSRRNVLIEQSALEALVRNPKL